MPVAQTRYAEAPAPTRGAALGALQSICGELHNYGGQVDRRRPLRLGLALEHGAFLRLCERRGDAIGCDSRPLAPERFADGSRVEVHDLTETLCPGLRGARLRSLAAIEDALGAMLGVALLRLDGPPFCIWIEDDEFRWGEEPALRAAAAARGDAIRIAGPLAVA